MWDNPLLALKEGVRERGGDAFGPAIGENRDGDNGDSGIGAGDHKKKGGEVSTPCTCTTFHGPRVLLVWTSAACAILPKMVISVFRTLYTSRPTTMHFWANIDPQELLSETAAKVQSKTGKDSKVRKPKDH
jgi:hypothetical protein